MRRKYDLNETFLARPKLLRRWDVSKQKLDEIMDRHKIKPTLIGCRQKYKMSDISRIEALGLGQPTPARKARENADAVAA